MQINFLFILTNSFTHISNHKQLDAHVLSYDETADRIQAQKFDVNDLFI